MCDESNEKWHQHEKEGEETPVELILADQLDRDCKICRGVDDGNQAVGKHKGTYCSRTHAKEKVKIKTTLLGRCNNYHPLTDRVKDAKYAGSLVMSRSSSQYRF